MSGRDTRRSAGFTLVELMVAVALMALVLAWLTQTFTVQHRTYTVVEQVTESQQNSLVIAGLMEQEIRSAGFMVPENLAVCGVDNLNGPDLLFVSAAEILDPSGIDHPDLALGLSASSAGFNEGDGGVGQILRLEDRILPDGDNLGFFDANGDGTNDIDFWQGMGVIAMDESNLARGSACGRITDPVPNGTPGSNVNLVVDWEATMDGGPAGWTSIRVVPAHIYEIDANNNLLRDGQVLAPEVEDLQVSYFFDRDEDGTVAADGSETPGAAGSAQFDTSAPPAGGWLGSELREVRVSVVVRTRDPDPNQRFNDGAFQPTENRLAVAGSDRFRRRVHQATVRVRNVGFRD
jgi:prepilin-type N-terminal cleavage/methylation domain-containing protein